MRAGYTCLPLTLLRHGEWNDQQDTTLRSRQRLPYQRAEEEASGERLSRANPPLRPSQLSLQCLIRRDGNILMGSSESPRDSRLEKLRPIPSRLSSLREQE